MTTKTARQQLAEVIKFLRLDRQLDIPRAANLAKVPARTFLEWEQGFSVPGENAWDRLKNAVSYRLKGHEDLWRKARTEERIGGAVVVAAPLTQRPFAALQMPVVAPPAPKKAAPFIQPSPPPKAVTEPKNPGKATIPETLLGEGYDLQSAYIAVNQLPEGWNTKLAAQERADYARELLLLSEGLTTQEVIAKVREKFKVGISSSTVTTIREVLKKEGKMTEPMKKREPIPTPTPPPVPSAVVAQTVRTAAAPVKTTNDQEIKAAIEMLLEAVPDLVRLSIVVDTDGSVKMDYAVREMRVVETGRSLKIR